MSQRYSLEAVAPIREVVSAIMSECRASGLNFRGDQESGEIQGMGVKITYAVSGSAIEVTVHRKPFFVSSGMIENAIRSRSKEFGVRFVGRR